MDNLLTLILFGGLGFVVARLFASPVSAGTWALLAIGTIAGCFVGVNTALLSVFGFAIRLNWAVASTFLGIMIGLVLRPRRVSSRPA